MWKGKEDWILTIQQGIGGNIQVTSDVKKLVWMCMNDPVIYPSVLEKGHDAADLEKLFMVLRDKGLISEEEYHMYT